MKYKDIIVNGNFKEISKNRVNKVLNYIIDSNFITNKCIYISSSIYQNKQYLYNLENIYDIKIVNIKSNILSYISPIPIAKDILIKINDPKQIVDIFNILDEQNPVELYIFNKNLEKLFVDNFIFHNTEQIENLLSQDDEYLIYGVDFDNEDALETNILEYTSYGSKIQHELWFL